MEEDKKQIRNFRVIDYGVHYGLIYNMDYPSSFEAEIKTSGDKIGLDGIIDEVVDGIKRAKDGPTGHQVFDYFARIPYTNRVIDEEDRVAAFVLLKETPLFGGMNWQEAVYGIKIEGNKIRGFEICYNSGSSGGCSLGIRSHGYNEGSRLMVHKIEGGIVKYTLKTKDGFHDRECDMKKDH